MSYYGECLRKIPYRTKRAALDAQTAMGIHMRAYRCPHCHEWHLTSDVAGNSAPGTRPVDWKRSRAQWLRKQAR